MSDTQKFLKVEKKRAGKLISLSVAMGTLGGLLLIFQAWCLATVVDAIIIQQQSLADVMPWMWGMLTFLVLRSLLAYVTEQVAFSSAAIIKQSLRERLYSKLQRLGVVYLTDERSGELSTVLTDGIEALEAYYAKYLPAMSQAALIPLSILVFVFPFDWQSALVMLVTAPLIPFFMILIGNGAERLNQQQWKQLQRMGGHFLDVIQGLTTLKLFNASQRESLVIARISEDYRLATMKVLRVAFLSALALEFFATVSIAVVAVLIGFRLLFGELDFFVGFFVLLLAPEFYLPLRSLGTHYHSRMNAIGAAEKMLEILDAPADEGDSAAKQRLLPDIAIGVRFEEVSFAYKAQQPVLQEIDFVINPGEKVAIVGPTGAGKTTLSNLLLGFIRPDTGRVVVNDVDLMNLEAGMWHSNIAWVPQRPRVFHGTVAANISLGLHNVSMASLEAASLQANAMEFILKLPNGFDTVIGESGRALSGGQVQRLVLARAFLRKARLVILDEATANLDSENEKLLQQAIDLLATGRSMLIIAHRLKTVRNADKILVLENGRVTQSGTHEVLIKTPGMYQRLVTAQGTLS